MHVESRPLGQTRFTIAATAKTVEVIAAAQTADDRSFASTTKLDRCRLAEHQSSAATRLPVAASTVRSHAAAVRSRVAETRLAPASAASSLAGFAMRCQAGIRHPPPKRHL